MLWRRMEETRWAQKKREGDEVREKQPDHCYPCCKLHQATQRPLAACVGKPVLDQIRLDWRDLFGGIDVEGKVIQVGLSE